jgi:hypothetical protein
MFGNTSASQSREQIRRTGITGRSSVKRVFDYPQCAHVWAQQTQQDGRSPKGQMYFHGDTIFSYGAHYPIARYTDATLNGARVVLFNSEKNSPTTGTHKDCVKRALRGLNVRVFEVPNVTERHYDQMHTRNLDSLVSTLTAHATRVAKAHVRASWNDEDNTLFARVASLEPMAQTIRDYCEAFGLDTPELQEAEKVAAIHAGFARYNAPKKVAQRAVSAANKSARVYKAISQAHAYLEGVTNIIPSLAFIPVGIAGFSKWSVESAMGTEAYARRPHKSGAEKPVTPEAWINGAGSAAQYGFKSTLVRRKGATLETSQGAECPFKHSVVAFLKAQDCRANATDWHTNGDQVRVGHFKVDAIDTEGNLRAGCHTIAFENMLALAMREVPQLVKACFPLPALIG